VSENDHRIPEDLNLFVSGTVGLAIGGLRAVVTLVSFVAILWGLSGTVAIPFGRSSIALTETRLYRLLRERLPGTALFSVGHRGTLRPLHAREFVVRPDGSGPGSIVEVTAGVSQPIG